MPQAYSSWSLEKLKKERLKIDKAIETAEKRDKKATLAKMAVIAKQNGFELHELMSGGDATPAASAKTRLRKKSSSKKAKARKAAKPRAKVAPKYRNPNDATQTWTGRGRQPLWVKELVDGGSTLDDLTIPASEN